MVYVAIIILLLSCIVLLVKVLEFVTKLSTAFDIFENSIEKCRTDILDKIGDLIQTNDLNCLNIMDIKKAFYNE